MLKRTTIKARSSPKLRRYPLQRIKTGNCYDVGEISDLFKLHRNTVRHWLKSGLKTIDDTRPLLIHGSALKSYLNAKQSSKSAKCALNELFCFRCKAPRKPWGGLVDFKIKTDKVAHATALCECCETTMHRTVRRADTPTILKLNVALQLPLERLNDCPLPNENSDLERV